MALAWKAGWVKALRGSNPLSSATVIEVNDPERVPRFESGGHATAPPLLPIGLDLRGIHRRTNMRIGAFPLALHLAQRQGHTLRNLPLPKEGSDGFVCPRWANAGGWAIADGRYTCASCGARTAVTAGTLFNRRRTPLTVWFEACWMFTSDSSREE